LKRLKKPMDSKSQYGDNEVKGDIFFPQVWTVFGPAGKGDPEPDFAGMTDIPAELVVAGNRLAAKQAVFAENCLELGALLDDRLYKGPGTEAGYLLAELVVDKDMEVEFGAGADYWMKWWINGEVVCDTLALGNNGALSIVNHRFPVRLKAGRNLIAVQVVNGDGGFGLSAGGPRELRAWRNRLDAIVKARAARTATPGRPIQAIKEDWDTVKTRLTHWWANELYDRAVLCVTAPKYGVEPARPWPGGAVTPEIHWTNVDYMIWRMEEQIRTTCFGGDAVPVFAPGWSVGHALLFGCEPKFRPGTVWTDPLPAGPDGYPPIRFHREGRWRQWMNEATLKAAQASRGRWFVNPAWGNDAGDILSNIRGDMSLMVDIADNPGWVKHAVKQVSDILIEVYEEWWKMADESVSGFEGSMAYAMWSPGRGKEFSCDISCNISPKQFEELFLPPLIEAMRTVDHRYYHLDGAVALHHLDLLLSVPEIHAIQWQPGTGHFEIMQWVPLIKRIQQAGKSVQVFCSPQSIPALLNEVSARGLCIVTSCASEVEIQDLERQATRLSRDRQIY